MSSTLENSIDHDDQLTQLQRENEELRAQLEESREVLRAIQAGEIDAVVVEGTGGPQVFTLQSAEQPYRLLVEQMREGAVVLVREGVIQYANSAFATMLGLPLERVLGSDIRRFIVETDHALFDALLAQMAGGTGRGEVSLCTADEHRVLVYLGLSTTIISGVASVCLVVTDLTERKRHQDELLELNADLEKRVAERTRALRESEARFRAISSSTPDHILMQDRDLRYVFVVNPQLGLTEQEMIGKTDHDFLSREDADRLTAIKRRVLQTGKPVHVETALQAAAGEQYFSGDYVPRFTADGRTDGVIGYFRNITERKEAEKLLRDRESQLRLALEAGRMATWDWDIPTSNVKWNDEHYRMLGYEPGAFAPTYQHWIARVHPDDRAVAEAKIRKSMKEGGKYANEFRTLWPDGTERWLEARGRFDFDAAGKTARNYGVMLDITRRKRAEESLRQTRDYLEKLFAYANAPIICWDPRRAITRFNPAFERLTGYATDEVMGRDLSMLFPDETRDDSLAKIKRALTERWEVVEIRIQRKDGETRVALWNSANVYAEDGTTILATIAQGQDITQRKQAEEALRQSEEQFRALADAMTNLAWWANADGYLTWYNRRWYEYTGATPEQMEGWGWQSVHDPQALPAVMARWQASIATGDPFDMTFPLRGADGQYRRFLTRAMPLKDAQGRVERWFGTNTDVEELTRTEEALRQSEERLRLAQESANVGIWEWNVQTGALEFTPELNRIYGLPPETIKTYEDWRVRVHPDDIGSVENGREEALARHESFDLEFRGRHSSGEYRWISTKGGALYDEAGKATRVFGVNIDITARKRTEEALRESERLYRAIGESIDYGIWVCDAQGRNTYTSDSLLKLVGITREQCADFGWGNVLYPEDAEATIAAWKECVRTGSAWYREHRYRGVDGKWHPILACGVPVRDERGTITCWAGDKSGYQPAEGGRAGTRGRQAQRRAGEGDGGTGQPGEGSLSGDTLARIAHAAEPGADGGDDFGGQSATAAGSERGCGHHPAERGTGGAADR